MKKYVTIHTQCVNKWGEKMEIKDKIIPYRTVTEWERGTRKMPDYVLRLLAYKVKMDDLIVKEDVNEE